MIIKKGQSISIYDRWLGETKISDPKPSYKIRLLKIRSHFQTDQYRILMERYI